MRTRISFLIVLFVCGTAVMADAQKPVGKIDEVRLPATVTKTDGGKADAKEGMPIFPGDIIETGENGEIRLSLDRLGMFMLGEETEISVDELSGADDDDDTVLRLVAGYLRIAVAKFSDNRTVVHTPTAVIGVRGTEFDAMASIDATTLVAVDKGAVDVLSQDKTMTVSQGMMFESGIGEEMAGPEKAVPREKRNWRDWRKKRENRFLDNCDKIAPEFKKRYSERVEKFAELSEKLNASSLGIGAELENARTAKRNGKRMVFSEAVKRLKGNAAEFGKMAAHYRKVLNRVNVSGKMMNRMERFLIANKEKKKAARALEVLDEIREQRAQVKKTARDTVSTVKTTFRDLRAFRRELRW